MATEKYVGLGREVTYDTLAAVEEFCSVLNESIKLTREQIELPSAGRRVMETITSGMAFSEGPYSFQVEPENTLGLLLSGVLGTDVVAGVDPFTHTWLDTADDSTIISNTAHVLRSETSNPLAQYRGTMVDQLELACEAGGPLIATPTLYGSGSLTRAPSAAATFPTADADKRPFYFHDATTTELDGAASTSVRSLSLTFNNNIDKDNHGLGSQELENKPGVQRLDMDITMGFIDIEETLRDKYESGTEEVDWHFKWDVAADSRSFELDLPKIQITDFSDHGISGRDIIRSTMTGKVLFEDDTENYAVQAILENGQSTSYTS